MTASRNRRRPGFSLLEVLLASAIAILLLGALYAAFDVTVRQTQASRDAVDSDNLSRAVFNRMSVDLSSSLVPLPPLSGGNTANNTFTDDTVDPATTDPAAATATDAAATDAAATTTPAATTTTPGTAAEDATAAPAAMATGFPFQAGVKGDSKQLTVFVSRLPDVMGDAARFAADADGGPDGASDMRRVSYWLSGTGRGLCRQVRDEVTADGVGNSTDPDRTDEADDVIADEVVDVQFEYFDGSGWAAEWDGSAVSADGATPQGPPRAVRVTLTVEVAPTRPGEPPFLKRSQQVIPIRAAAGLATPDVAPAAEATDPDAGATTGVTP